jgi:acyl-CoA ligase (AMP-forming) (exosortase A-associated)
MMTLHFDDILSQSALRFADSPALKYKSVVLTYSQLQSQSTTLAMNFSSIGLCQGDRLAVYLPKQPENILSIFATSQLGAVFVPINPVAKPKQVRHILEDCGVKILVTTLLRWQQLEVELSSCCELFAVVLVDAIDAQLPLHPQIRFYRLESDSSKNLVSGIKHLVTPIRTECDVAAILYTSGSTGNPKGVVLSHRNLVAGAMSVSQYLQNSPSDIILALLPLSFDYGLSQITTAFYSGACVVLFDFFLVQDVVRIIATEKVTGIAAVPPLWAQLAAASWPPDSTTSVRYFTNSGGAMPKTLLEKLQNLFINAKPYLMYGLTEAFRSTYLPPEEISNRADSIGKAIPNAQIVVVRQDGTLCQPGEVGELVHRGPLVSLGYWNDPEQTALRFKPDPVVPLAQQIKPMAVWSGDLVRADTEGFLYYVGRNDEMIKTSGYRVSPTEVEAAIYKLDVAIEQVAAVAADWMQVDHVILVVFSANKTLETDRWRSALAAQLPSYMLPKVYLQLAELPMTANGKIDRKLLRQSYQTYFSGTAINE